MAAIVHVLDRLSQVSIRDDFERHMFSQMMRYSILSAVVDDAVLVERFFDNISKIDYCRRQVLFWLQWHMAKIDQLKFVDAEKFLDRGYTEAENFEKRAGRIYDRKQLDDRRAKFLMKRGIATSRHSHELFRDLKEASEIVGKLLRREDVTHHPFETLELISKLFGAHTHDLNDNLRRIAQKTITDLIQLAKKRIGMVAEGYQRSMADKAITNTESSITKS